MTVCLAWCGMAQAQDDDGVVKRGKGWYTTTDGTVVVTADYDGKDLNPYGVSLGVAPKRLVIDEGVTSIENWKLRGLLREWRWESVSFPKSLEKVSLMENWDLDYHRGPDWDALVCDSSRILICADTVYAPWETPVGIENGLFQRVWGASGERRDSPLLIVPKGCIDAYKASDWSRDFAYIGDERDYYRYGETVTHEWPIYMRGDWGITNDTLSVTKDFQWSNGREVWFDNDYRSFYLKLEEGVRSIGDYAFDYFIRQTTVTLPESLERIGRYAFRKCGMDMFCYLDLTIPKGVKYIGKGAFEDAEAYPIPEIPEGCEYLGSRAFAFRDLEKVRIPGGLKHWDFAFKDCKELREVEFSKNLKTIGVGAFQNCESLSRTKTQQWFGVSKGLVLPPNLEKIGAGAFMGCSSLEHIVLPASVDTVWNYAFQYCMYSDDNKGDKVKLHDFRVDCYALWPPVKGWYLIGGNFKADLYVPAESVERYKASKWAEEFNIYPLDPDEENPYTALEDVKSGKLKVSVRGGVVSVEGVDKFDVCDLSGRKMPVGRPLPAGVYVVSTPAGSERVVVK